MGDPFSVDGMDEYQADILKQSTADGIQKKILDQRTQNVSGYNPNGFGESGNISL